MASAAAAESRLSKPPPHLGTRSAALGADDGLKGGGLEGGDPHQASAAGGVRARPVAETRVIRAYKATFMSRVEGWFAGGLHKSNLLTALGWSTSAAVVVEAPPAAPRASDRLLEAGPPNELLFHVDITRFLMALTREVGKTPFLDTAGIQAALGELEVKMSPESFKQTLSTLLGNMIEHCLAEMGGAVPASFKRQSQLLLIGFIKGQPAALEGLYPAYLNSDLLELRRAFVTMVIGQDHAKTYADFAEKPFRDMGSTWLAPKNARRAVRMSAEEALKNWQRCGGGVIADMGLGASPAVELTRSTWTHRARLASEYRINNPFVLTDGLRKAFLDAVVRGLDKRADSAQARMENVLKELEHWLSGVSEGVVTGQDLKVLLLVLLHQLQHQGESQELLRVFNVEDVEAGMRFNLGLEWSANNHELNFVGLLRALRQQQLDGMLTEGLSVCNVLQRLAQWAWHYPLSAAFAAAALAALGYGVYDSLTATNSHDNTGPVDDTTTAVLAVLGLCTGCERDFSHTDARRLHLSLRALERRAAGNPGFCLPPTYDSLKPLLVGGVLTGALAGAAVGAFEGFVGLPADASEGIAIFLAILVLLCAYSAALAAGREISALLRVGLDCWAPPIGGARVGDGRLVTQEGVVEMVELATVRSPGRGGSGAAAAGGSPVGRVQNDSDGVQLSPVRAGNSDAAGGLFSPLGVGLVPEASDRRRSVTSVFDISADTHLLGDGSLPPTPPGEPSV